MTTEFGSFNASPGGAFQESQAHARNREEIDVEIVRHILVMVGYPFYSPEPYSPDGITATPLWFRHVAEWNVQLAAFRTQGIQLNGIMVHVGDAFGFGVVFPRDEPLPNGFIVIRINIQDGSADVGDFLSAVDASGPSGAVDVKDFGHNIQNVLGLPDFGVLFSEFLDALVSSGRYQGDNIESFPLFDNPWVDSARLIADRIANP